MKNLPVINGVKIKSIELLNGVYICTGENQEPKHIETIVPEKFPFEIKEMMKSYNLTWIDFKSDEIIQFQTTKFTLSEVNVLKLDDKMASDIATDIMKTLLYKTFNIEN